MEASKLLGATHRFFAVECNNAAWQLIGAGSDPDSALEHAWASLFHWRACGAPVNVARAYGTVSRALTLAGQAELALEFADRYAAHDGSEGFETWDACFAASARARALAGLGRADESRDAQKRAAELAEAVDDEEDRKICLEDLRQGPWAPE